MLVEARECLNEEPKRLREGDRLGEPVLLGVLLDPLSRHVDQMHQVEFDDCVDVLHLQSLRLVRVVRTPAA